MKLYTGGLQKPLLDILNKEKLKQLPITMVKDPIADTRRITFVRHLESKYNEYKEFLKQDSTHQEFLETSSRQRKEELVPILLKDFITEVGIDYET